MTAVIIIVVVALLMVGSYYIRSRSLSSGYAFLPDGLVRERLNGMEVVYRGDAATFGAARMERRDGNIILHLRGTPYEMGYQHGVLLEEDIREGVVPLFAVPVGQMPEYRDKPLFLKKLMMKYLEFAVYAPIERNTPRAYLEELRGIADGSGIDYRSIFIANFLSDLTMAMLPRVIARRLKALKLSPECSDFAASGAATSDGKLIIGRNTDYSGQGRWMAHQTIFFYHPEDQYSYVKVSTAGMLKCNTAMNERGIVVGGHFMGFAGAKSSGVSFTIFENEIMRRTASIDEAITLLRESRRGGSFGLMISDGKTGNAVVAEATRDFLGVRGMENSTICLTNFATTPELKGVDLLARHNIMMRDLIGRYKRLNDLIEKNYGNITPKLAAEFMGNHSDFIVGRERPVGFVVGNTINVTSVIFQPADGLFWAATGSEPACNSEYVGFDFRAEMRGKASRVKPPVLKGYRWEDNSHEKALRAYMAAFIAHSENPSDAVPIRHLEIARGRDPREPVFSRILAEIYLHRGEYDLAEKLLRESLDCKQSGNEEALVYLRLGQACDLMGKRDEALRAYRIIVYLSEKHGNDFISGINSMVYGIARKHLALPFCRRDIKEIPIGFNLGSVLD